MTVKIYKYSLFLLMSSVYSTFVSGNCSHYFRYVKVGSHNYWLGQLSMTLPEEGLPVHVVVELALPAVLANRYAGVIELSNPPPGVYEEVILGKINKLEYTIRFPLPFPLPAVVKIIVNNRMLCSANEVKGLVVTYIKLEHVFPSNVFIKNSSLSSQESEKELCGISTLLSNVSGTFINGHGEWPWLAALIIKERDELLFHCTGSLISFNHVITAAHCLSRDIHNSLDYSSIIVYLGKHNLEDFGEKFSQIKEVKNVFIHPDFSSSYYNNDLAVILLSSAIKYDMYVKPVCLWDDDGFFDSSSYSTGTIVGWRKDSQDEEIKPIPRTLIIPIVDQEECLRSQKDFLYITSKNTICGGLRNGSGPCNGDSGNGLILKRFNNILQREVWQLRGIVSLALLDQNLYSCNLDHYVVFTDVSKYLPWIKKIMSDH